VKQALKAFSTTNHHVDRKDYETLKPLKQEKQKVIINNLIYVPLPFSTGKMKN
jgi:hypothetical protein